MMTTTRTGATQEGKAPPKGKAPQKGKASPKGKALPTPAATTTTEDFFRRLSERGHEPILKSDSGTLRFDVDRGGQIERWFVTVACGDVSVSHARSRADTVLSLDGELFDQLIAGTANAVSAQLRGLLVAEGDLHLMMVFQRLFPGPPRRSRKDGPFHLGVKEGARR
jgi:SCP-2 sterol transfer family